jgi:heptosyltransferase-2
LLPDSDNPQSCLIIRLSSLGDILLTTPALRSLHKTHPQARIDVLVRSQYRELLEDNPHISGLLSPEEPLDGKALKKLTADLNGRYKVVIDLHTSLRSAFLRRRLGAQTVLKYQKRRLVRWFLVRLKRNFYGGASSIPLAYLEALQGIGVEDDGQGLEWPAALARRQQFLSIAGLESEPDSQPIALCPGASFATKRWPLESWKGLAFRLVEKGYSLWIFGDKTDQEAGVDLEAIDFERIRNFCGDLSIAESGAGLSFCRLAVTHDAGPAHMAAAVGIPVVSIFGSTVPQFGFEPFRIPHRIAEVVVRCRPCSHLGFEACPEGHFRCMKDQTPDSVLSLIDDLAGEIGR